VEDFVVRGISPAGEQEFMTAVAASSAWEDEPA